MKKILIFILLLFSTFLSSLDPPTDLFVTEYGYAFWLAPSECNSEDLNTGIIRDLLGYNTYRDGVFQVFTTDLYHQYVGLESSTTYLAEVTALYDAGESAPVGFTFTTPAGTTYDPPTNVTVDDEIGTISWFPPMEIVIEDNFDSYTSGDYIAEVGDDWTTWSNAPGGAEDALVSDAHSYSPSNSVSVLENNDLVLIMDDYAYGIVVVDLKMYVPIGYCGYFNLQKTSTPGEECAFQIYFQTNGDAVTDASAAAILFHPFNHDEWMDIRVMIDLDNDWATYYFNGVEMIGYHWTLGTFGIPGLLQFGGVNIKGVANYTQPADVPMFYVDDVVLSVISEDITGFNLYLDGVFDCSVFDVVYEYTYQGLVPGQTYLAGVSTLYDSGESEIITEEFTYPGGCFQPPNSVGAVVVDYNDVELTWNAPGHNAEWIQWDSGDIGNAIGLTNPGTFYVASHWYPVDLTIYDGAVISKIKFYPTDEAIFAVKVWTGANASTLVSSEDVSTYTIGEFQEVELSNPVAIDASQELWFGYEVIQAGTEHPAGADLGPAIAGYGDMISLDGSSWDSLFQLAGFDYNWNLAAYVEEADGSVLVLNKPNRTKKAEVRNSGINRNIFSSIPVEQVSDTRSLAGYKIYQDGIEVGEVADPATLTYLVESLDAGTYEFTITAIYNYPPGESCPTEPVSASIILNPPSNVQAQSMPPNIVITWSPPDRGVDNYNVYRDDVLIAEGMSGLMFIDVNVPGFHYWNITAVYDGGWESVFSATVWGGPGPGTDPNLLPFETALNGNYPNPFNPTTTISFSTKEAGYVSLNIYNMKGQLVKKLIEGNLEAAYHNVLWDSRDDSNKTVSSGIYFYKMKTTDYTATQKMILMK